MSAQKPSVLEESGDAARGRTILQQFGEHVTEGVTFFVGGFQNVLHAGVGECPRGSGTPPSLVAVEQRLVDIGLVAKSRCQHFGENDRVGQADVECRASSAEDMRGIASKKDAADAVALGLPAVADDAAGCVHRGEREVSAEDPAQAVPQLGFAELLGGFGIAALFVRAHDVEVGWCRVVEPIRRSDRDRSSLGDVRQEQREASDAGYDDPPPLAGHRTRGDRDAGDSRDGRACQPWKPDAELLADEAVRAVAADEVARA